MKPLFVDALHINMGGGLMVLNYLVDNLVAEAVDFVLLKDARCPYLHTEAQISRVYVMKASFTGRRRFYIDHRGDFSRVLCFGNIPPYVRLNVPVHTYFHNVSLLKIPRDYGLKKKLVTYLKRLIIKLYAPNTTDWIVQTSNTANLVRRHLAGKRKPVMEFPFFNIPSGIKRVPRAERHDYVFVGEYTSAKGHEYLVKAWEKLSVSGFDATLHLTVSNPDFCRVIDRAVARGARIVNHGCVPFDEVVALYNRSKAIIYPSFNESLGLGIVEAVKAGCDVIGCDLPYIHCVCRPSGLFAPASSEAIIEAVRRYEASPSAHTVLTIDNKIHEFVEFLKQETDN